MKVILVENKETKKIDIYKNLRTACQLLDIKYNTITKKINGSGDTYENKNFVVKRVAIQ